MSKAVPANREEYIVASHDALFVEVEATRCDACGGELSLEDDDGYGMPGAGIYLWTRGDEVRVERAPLCASCASAIGVTALARWEIEEEES
ncbi:MAG TPA: hypothetical protein VGM06_17485 [Polyangiaceae bacterium]|jgi:hypothetical protein